MIASTIRRSGLLIPLFSCPSSISWGIGEIGDVAPVAAWLAASGQRVLQLLPLNEMASGERSPYAALSAMAIDPIFIRLADVPDFATLGGEASLDAANRDDLDRVRQTARVDHAAVRRLKDRALAQAFAQFLEAEWRHDSTRARSLHAFLAEQAWWIHDYALFRALHEREDHRPWTDWPDALQRRDPAALDAARRELAREVLYRQYLQWVADGQWRAARAAARAQRVDLLGDLPFMVDGDSADVWAHQADFRLDVSVGAPPDAFSPTGQDWGLPAYRWDTLAANDFRWLRDRARRSASLYDAFRVDHLVGFYRTYTRPRHGGEPSFAPSTEAEQVQLGERMLALFRESGAEILAEDLGVVPDFVRASLARLGVSGFRVFRWERHWKTAGHPFCDPSEYPAMSVAVSGTHDTEPMIVWWEDTPVEDRRQIAALPTVQRIARGSNLLTAPFADAVRDVLLEALFASGSNLLLLPIQDVFGWRNRINAPGTVTPENWTFRLPWPCDQMDDYADARERRDALRSWAEKHSR